MTQSGGIRILLVEDNLGDADLIREMLDDTGRSSSYLLTHAFRVREAVALLGAGKGFSVIVSDIKLPDSEGRETVEALARAAGKTPLIMITSSVDSEFALTAINIGAQDYLPKGKFDGEMLVRSIRYAIERKAADVALKESEAGFRSLVQSVKDYAIFHLGPEGRIASWNGGAESIFGWRADEILGRHVSLLFDGSDLSADIPALELARALQAGSSVFEGFQITKGQERIDAIVTTTALISPEGGLSGYSQIIRDVTQSKKADGIIRYQASHDPLTGLSNRKDFDERFLIEKLRAEGEGGGVALMFLDLDRFKNINDTLGHVVGDKILKDVSSRLKKSVRRDDTVCRLGGDEFIMLISDYGSLENIGKLAKEVLGRFSEAFQVDGRSLHVGASLGIAIFPEDGNNVHTLLKNADTALYRAKDGGRNRYVFYDPDMNAHLGAKLSLEQGLRNAFAKEEFELHYQPFIDLVSGEAVGAEALVRWNHPELGLLLPAEFIPLAEESGLITELGQWAFREACRQSRKWSQENPNFTVSVNLSGRQFNERGLLDEMDSAFEAEGVLPSSIELEITESVAMENLEGTASKLQLLREKGITVAIDDFGTGYSSLSYLKKFPVNKLKIDKSFVINAFNDPQDQAIVKGIISMGHSLGLAVCAEGIESKEQLSMLQSLGCDLGQGFHISKPITGAEFLEWARRYGLNPPSDAR